MQSLSINGNCIGLSQAYICSSVFIEEENTNATTGQDMPEYFNTVSVPMSPGHTAGCHKPHTGLEAQLYR